MKETLKIIPKKDEIITKASVREANGEWFVDYDVKKEYIPKPGDFVKIQFKKTNIYDKDYIIVIWPEKIHQTTDSAISDIALLTMNNNLCIGATVFNLSGEITKASEDEKEELLNALAKAGYLYRSEAHIVKKDLPKNSIVMCGDSTNDFYVLGIYLGEGFAITEFSSSFDHSDYKYDIIVPIEHFDIKTLKFDEEHNYGM